LFLFESNCNSVPFISVPELTTYKLDDSVLFMMILSKSLIQIVSKIKNYKNIRNPFETIAQLAISMIINEESLDVTAQSMLDKIKREYDSENNDIYNERDDMTLILRFFDNNLKANLLNQHQNSNLQTMMVPTDESDDSSGSDSKSDDDIDDEGTINNDTEEDDFRYSSGVSLSDSVRSKRLIKNRQNSINSQSSFYVKTKIDENDQVKPYVDFTKLEIAIAENEDIFDELGRKLMNLTELEERF
jgi:hypothetical protein